MELLLRRLALAIGLVCGLLGTQAPEFAQQYRQRLAGAVDELSRVVATFDAEARGQEPDPGRGDPAPGQAMAIRSRASAGKPWPTTRSGSRGCRTRWPPIRTGRRSAAVRFLRKLRRHHRPPRLVAISSRPCRRRLKRWWWAVGLGLGWAATHLVVGRRGGVSRGGGRRRPERTERGRLRRRPEISDATSQPSLRAKRSNPASRRCLGLLSLRNMRLHDGRGLT